MNIEEVRSVLQQLDELTEVWGDEGKFRRCRDRLRDAIAKSDAEAAERAMPITEEWLRSIGAIIDAEDGVVEFCWLPGELVILSGGLLLWTVDCVEVGKIATRGQLLDVHGVIARS